MPTEVRQPIHFPRALEDVDTSFTTKRSQAPTIANGNKTPGKHRLLCLLSLLSFCSLNVADLPAVQSKYLAQYQRLTSSTLVGFLFEHR